MTGDAREQRRETRLVANVRDRIGWQTVVILLTGVLAGYSLSVLGKETIIVPVVGSVPGYLLGTVGLLVAVGVYHRVGCCGECNQATFGLGNDCSCTDDCGDSCSYDP